MKKWVAIDPGLGGTGWARFDGIHLKDWGIIRLRENIFENKALDISNRLKDICRSSGRVFIEWPSFQNLIAQNTGSIIKLAFLIGVIYREIDYPYLIPVIRWKGNLPKEITKKRAEKYFGITGFKSHAADAVGIGMYCLKNSLI